MECADRDYHFDLSYVDETGRTLTPCLPSARQAPGQPLELPSVALAEATHKAMLAEVVRQHNVTPQGLISRLKKHPELLDNLTEHQQVAALAQALKITVVPYL